MQASTQVARKVGSRQTGWLPGWQVDRQTMAECLNGIITFVLLTFARMTLRKLDIRIAKFGSR